MAKDEKLEFAGFEVVVSPDKLKFDENTLTNYLQTEGGYYDNFGAYLALAEKNQQNKEILHEKLFSERFDEAKENGSTEKQAEAKAKSDPDVFKMKEDIIEAKYIVNRLKQHLRAWDKNHDNAQSVGHMLRKIMDKLHGDSVMGTTRYIDNRGREGLDEAVQEIIGSSNSFADDLSGAL